jgi:hypothetical protein
MVGFAHGGMTPCQGLSWEYGLAWTLALVAEMELARGRLELSTKLLRAVAEYRGSFRLRTPFDNVTEYESNIATVNAYLGDLVFEAAWTAARALTVEQAAGYALQQFSLL